MSEVSEDDTLHYFHLKHSYKRVLAGNHVKLFDRLPNVCLFLGVEAGWIN